MAPDNIRQQIHAKGPYPNHGFQWWHTAVAELVVTIHLSQTIVGGNDKHDGKKTTVIPNMGAGMSIMINLASTVSII